jgi:membrane protease YdiL (CAAX protease family)
MGLRAATISLRRRSGQDGALDEGASNRVPAQTAVAIVGANRWETGSWPAAIYWTLAKLCIWIAPTVWILRRAGEPIAATTGIATTRRLGGGLSLACAWLAVQVAWSGVRGQWPSPPARIGGYGAFNAYLVAPLLEEYVFRGFALRRLRNDGVSFWPAALATSVAFGLLHVPGWLLMNGMSAAALSPVGPVILLGVVLAAVSWRVPSLWACSAIHLANNAWSGGFLSALAGSLL